MTETDETLRDEKVKHGHTFVRTADTLRPTSGFWIDPHFLKNRRPGVLGIYYGWVPGHGGDVWWICHETDEKGDGKRETAAAYGFNELTIIGSFLEPQKNWSGLRKEDE